MKYTQQEMQELLSTIKETIPLWVLGTEEDNHQAGLVNVFEAHSTENPPFQKVSSRLAELSWLQTPLSLNAALAYSRLCNSNTPPAQKKLLNEILNTNQADLPSEDLDALFQSGEQGLIIKHLFPLLRGDQGMLWFAGSWDQLLRSGSADLAENAIKMVPWGDKFSQLRFRFEAQYNFLYGSIEDCINSLSRLDDNIWSMWKQYMICETSLRAGRTEEAISALSSLWMENIWNINWGLKLHAMRHPVVTSDALASSGDVSILMYSWNNGKLIHNTLKNLAASNIGQAKIFALNNGSDDDTGNVIKNADKYFPHNSYTGIQLPVNAGAPAARNWLLAQPEVRKSKWAVFLDDDVELPENWLEELLATARHYNNPGAVGCRITSTSKPTSLQSADYHLFPPGNGTSQIEGLTEQIMVFDSCRNGFDYGQFSYTRPAVHVSGCCHMLNMDAVNRSGDFDICFNPTQFDDLERDLRAYLDGSSHVYAGQLRIGHIQHSSLAKAASIKSMAQVFGNKIKLESKYEEQQLHRIVSKDLSQLWADIESKWTELAQELDY